MREEEEVREQAISIVLRGEYRDGEKEEYVFDLRGCHTNSNRRYFFKYFMGDLYNEMILFLGLSIQMQWFHVWESWRSSGW